MENLTFQGEAMNASLEGMLIVEQFLHDNYQFRRNMLNGKVEFLRCAGSNQQAELECATKTGEDQKPQYRPLTQQALNSIILHAKREDICEGKNPRQDIQEYMEQKDMAQLVTACFRKPKDEETVKPLNCTQMLSLIQHEYPSLVINRSTRVYLGLAMKELGYDAVHYGNVPHYKAIPQKAA